MKCLFVSHLKKCALCTVKGEKKMNHELLSTAALTKWLPYIFSPICCFQIPLAGRAQDAMYLFWWIVFQWHCCSVNRLCQPH